MKKQLKVILFTLLMITMPWAIADNSFVVKNIEINGLQRVPRSTVLQYLPVKVGQQFNTADTSTAIHDLYATGLFQDINVSRQGNTLIVDVVERPTIGSVSVTGNKMVPKEKMEQVLKQLGLVEGNVFDSALLDRVKNGLKSEYLNMGHYNVRVDTTVTPQPRNRVAIRVEISEGKVAQVAKIDIVGNKVFSSKTLIKQMELTTPHLWSVLTRGDQYSKEKLDKSLDAIRNYYQDRGYIRFKIDSTQVLLTPDRKQVVIVIHVTEGERYTFKGYRVVGNYIVSEQKMRESIPIAPGRVFSRKVVTDSGQALGRAMGNLGYAFANINAQPDIDDEYRQVFVTFFVEPGQRIYVRRITFSGNTKTSDIVLRRELRQMEGSLVSLDNIDESKRRLDLLGYLDKAEVETKPVTGVDDQVDLDYHVTEGPTAQAIAGIGYGTTGFVVNASLNQNNFLGTGKTLGINFQNSLVSTNYSVTYNNPYYTPEGIQRGFTAYATRTTPGRLNVANYTTDTYGGSVNYIIPVTEYDSVNLGYGLQNLHLSEGSNPSTEIQDFVNENGSEYTQGLLTGGWTRNKLDRANFPTRGYIQNAGALVTVPLFHDSLEYYKLNYGAHYYHPIYSDYIISLMGNTGYGSGYGKTSELPFFVNYFAGGPSGYPGSVRGYAPNSLGPKDSNGSPIGGNFLVTGSGALIFPNPMQEKLRSSLFFDAGNVYTTQSSNSSGPVRLSTGLALDWKVPVLNVMLSVSLALPINHRKGDDTEPFQFNIGTNF